MTSLNQDARIETKADEKPSKKYKKSGAKGSLALLKEPFQLVCVSQDSYPRFSMLRKEGTLGSNHAVKLSKDTLHQKIGKEMVHREVSCENVDLGAQSVHSQI